MTKHYKTKETAIKWIQAGKGFTNVGFDLYREDREIFILAIKHDDTGICTGFIPKCFANDREIAWHFLNRHMEHMTGVGLLSVGKELLSDKCFVQEFIKKQAGKTKTWLYSLISNQLKHDKELCKDFVQYSYTNIMLVPDELKQDYDLLEIVASSMWEKRMRRQETVCLLEYLGLPNLEPEEILQYIKSVRLQERLETNLPKNETKQTAKI